MERQGRRDENRRWRPEGNGRKRELGVRGTQALHSVALGRFSEDMHCMKH